MADHLAAVVLAAGRSDRFGSDKLLAPFAGRPLGAHVADILCGLGLQSLIAVCPPGAARRAAIFSDRGFEVIANPDPARGMASSLGLGAERAIACGAGRLLICLADMPFVTASHLRALISASDAAEIVATACGDQRSPPAIFGRSRLPALLALTGEQGARQMLRSAVPVFADPDILRDVDTVADLP